MKNRNSFMCLLLVGFMGFAPAQATEKNLLLNPITFPMAKVTTHLKSSPESVAAVAMLAILFQSFYRLTTKPFLANELYNWNNFLPDASEATQLLAKGNVKEFCSKVHQMWLIYFVGRTKKLVDIEYKEISEDGKNEVVRKDKELQRLNFGFCGWLFVVAGSLATNKLVIDLI